mgnify:FL=1
MRTPKEVIFTNMCMVCDNAGNVLVQDRVDPNWSGIAFPGGHVENGESFTDAVIREVFEETGLTVSKLSLCGIKDWTRDDGVRYVVLLYKTSTYEGELKSSDEGEVFWTPVSSLSDKKLAKSMKTMLKVFLDDNISEHIFYKENDKWVEMLK